MGRGCIKASTRAHLCKYSISSSNSISNSNLYISNIRGMCTPQHRMFEASQCPFNSQLLELYLNRLQPWQMQQECHQTKPIMGTHNYFQNLHPSFSQLKRIIFMWAEYKVLTPNPEHTIRDHFIEIKSLLLIIYSFFSLTHKIYLLFVTKKSFIFRITLIFIILLALLNFYSWGIL